MNRDEVITQLAPHGMLRVAINYGNPILAQAGSVGEPAGISVDLAEAIASRLGLKIEFKCFDAAGKVSEAADGDVWDLAFLACDPARADRILFTAPYVVIEAAVLVYAGSPVRSFAELDRPGTRIAVGKGAAYELHLKRATQNAELVRADTSQGAIDLFAAGGLDAVAGIRQPLLNYASLHPDARVMDEPLALIRQAVGLPTGRSDALRLVQEILDDLGRQNFIKQTVARHGQGDALTV